MLKNILDLSGVVVLNKKQQKTVIGGASFTCYCGFVGGPYEHLTVTVQANTVGDALDSMNCGGAGATCSGNQQ
jgi:hypothetical protein